MAGRATTRGGPTQTWPGAIAPAGCDGDPPRQGTPPPPTGASRGSSVRASLAGAANRSMCTGAGKPMPGRATSTPSSGKPEATVPGAPSATALRVEASVTQVPS